MFRRDININLISIKYGRRSKMIQYQNCVKKRNPSNDIGSVLVFGAILY